MIHDDFLLHDKQTKISDNAKYFRRWNSMKRQMKEACLAPRLPLPSCFHSDRIQNDFTRERNKSIPKLYTIHNSKKRRMEKLSVIV